MNTHELAELGYGAYARDSDDMPEWTELPPEIQRAWLSVAEAITVNVLLNVIQAVNRPVTL